VQVPFGEVQHHQARGLLGGSPVRDGNGEPDELAHDLSGRGRQHRDIARDDYLGERLPAPQQDPGLGRRLAWKAQSEFLQEPRQLARHGHGLRKPAPPVGQAAGEIGSRQVNVQDQLGVPRIGACEPHAVRRQL